MAIEHPRRFFFYGTLIVGGPPPVRQAIRHLREVGPARTCGMLYAIADPEGWYPALVDGPGEVAGRLYETSPEFTAADLTALDNYEDYAADDPDGSLYRRVLGNAGGQPAQLYRFNQPLPDCACLIRDGDFAAWLAREGLEPFGG